MTGDVHAAGVGETTDGVGTAGVWWAAAVVAVVGTGAGVDVEGINGNLWPGVQAVEVDMVERGGGCGCGADMGGGAGAGEGAGGALEDGDICWCAAPAVMWEWASDSSKARYFSRRLRNPGVAVVAFVAMACSGLVTKRPLLLQRSDDGGFR